LSRYNIIWTNDNDDDENIWRTRGEIPSSTPKKIIKHTTDEVKKKKRKGVEKKTTKL